MFPIMRMKVPLPNSEPRINPICLISEVYLAYGEDNFDLVCLLVKRRYKIFATVGRDSAVSVVLSILLYTGAGPNSIFTKRNEPA